MSLAAEKALLALQLFVEGNSLRSAERITGVDINTLMKLLVRAGEKCEKVVGKLVVNIPVKDVQADEIWAFVGKKEGNKTPVEAHNDGIGDAYCFVAIERNTKLVLNFALGRRSQATTDAFIEGLRHATGRPALPDQHRWIPALRERDYDHAQRPLRLRATHQGVHAGPRRPAPVQSPRRDARGEGPSHGQPRSREDLHVLCGAPEPHDQNADAPPHAVDECLQQEVG